jgi:hypothetical protein
LHTTLAATLVGHKAGLLTDEVLNGVIMMMLVTATAAPILVSRFAVGLPLPKTKSETFVESVKPLIYPNNKSFTIVVPVANPETEQNLIQMAALWVSQTQVKLCLYLLL